VPNNPHGGSRHYHVFAYAELVRDCLVRETFRDGFEYDALPFGEFRHRRRFYEKLLDFLCNATLAMAIFRCTA
jgi:hypothetical protein